MSFSGEVKKELAAHVAGSADEQVTALAVLLMCLCRFSVDEEGNYHLEMAAGKGPAATKCFTLLQKTANISIESASSEEIRELASLIDLVDENGDLIDRGGATGWSLLPNERCVRSWLRNLFLCIGTVSDPGREYRLEFLCTGEKLASQLMRVLEDHELSAHVHRRRNYRVVTLQDAQSIADLLSLVGAHASLMNLENSRIVRQVRGQVNRRVNCETSNIRKSVDAAQKQIEDIRLIMNAPEYEDLPVSLKEIAQLRIENSEVSMKELGEMLDPPVGKSGVSHRLRKLTELAEKIRQNELPRGTGSPAGSKDTAKQGGL